VTTTPGRYRVEEDIAELVRDQLTDPVRQGGAKPVVTMSCRAVRRYLMEATVEGHRIVTDEPLHGGGTDLAPAPLRYFVAGVLECMLIWCVKVAAIEQVSITDLSAEAEAYLEPGTVGLHALSATEPIATGRGFARLELRITVGTDDGTSDERLLDVVRKGIRACPSAVTFARSATVELAVTHNGSALAL
jgi:uncharacterized OsmC-like protein